jgi:hypothetical protein
VSEADLKTYTLENGPAYAHPRRILIKDALPLTGVNKVDLRAVGLGAWRRSKSTVPLKRIHARLNPRYTLRLASIIHKNREYGT